MVRGPPRLPRLPEGGELTRAELRRFSGRVAFRLPDGSGDTLEFAGGARQSFEFRPVTKVVELIPDGMALGTALQRLPKGWDARVVEGGVRGRELPRDAAALARFDGTLTGAEHWGSWNMNRIWWDVTVRNGRATKIEEDGYVD